MLFNSYEFLLVFLPVAFLVFIGLGVRNQRWAAGWLAMASLLFYAWWNPPFLLLLLASIIFNYFSGVSLAESSGLSRKLSKKALLTLAIACNLGLLGYFKYSNFFLNNLNYVLGTDYHIDLVLPLGISFFTFTQIAFLVDACQGKAKEYNPVDYCLFVTFFPHLIAGPVLHHKEMMPQFARTDTYRLSYENIAVGIAIFFVGLFKKVMIADVMAAHATPVFAAAENGGTLAFFTAWEGALAYTFQLYFDFSGYSDMAIGLARLFGITMPANFDSPYRAVNIIDFWRRWHMTLSRFLRDYLYIPLGGNRKGPVRRYLNLLITMLLGGLWHGAGWTYIIWGGLHGIYLIVNHFWQAIWPWKPNRWWSRLVARGLTLLCVVVAWVFFRAQTLDGAWVVLRGMMNLPTMLNGRLGPLQAILEAVGFRFSGGYLASQNIEMLGYLIFWIMVVWWLPNTQQLFRKFKPVLENVRSTEGEVIPWLSGVVWRPSWVSGALIGALSVLGILGLSSATEFLYFQF